MKLDRTVVCQRLSVDGLKSQATAGYCFVDLPILLNPFGERTNPNAFNKPQVSKYLGSILMINLD